MEDQLQICGAYEKKLAFRLKNVILESFHTLLSLIIPECVSDYYKLIS